MSRVSTLADFGLAGAPGVLGGGIIAGDKRVPGDVSASPARQRRSIFDASQLYYPPNMRIMRSIVPSRKRGSAAGLGALLLRCVLDTTSAGGREAVILADDGALRGLPIVDGCKESRRVRRCVPSRARHDGCSSYVVDSFTRSYPRRSFRSAQVRHSAMLQPGSFVSRNARRQHERQGVKGSQSESLERAKCQE
jgi:hypothetical protein